MKFELIAIGEVKPDFLSRRIQKGIGANYSHVAVMVDEKLIFHCIGGGVCLTTLPELLADGPCVIRRRVEIPVERDCCAMTWLRCRMGTPYSNAQYLGFVFPFLRWLPWINNGNLRMVCSEFGAAFVAENSTLAKIAAMAYGDCDWIDPKKALDIAGGIYGEKRGS